MENPRQINSANVSAFGYIATFDLEAEKLIIDWSAVTTFIGNGINNITAIRFKVTDPTGMAIVEKSLVPAIMIAPIEVDINFKFGFGFYTISATLVEANGDQHLVEFTKEICEPKDWEKGYCQATVDHIVDCYAPSIQISETTVYSYLNKQPITKTMSGKIFYPEQILNAINFDFMPFLITGNEGIYTGTYQLRALTTALYDLGNQIYVAIPYKVSREFKVDCNNRLGDVMCCLNDMYELSSDISSAAGKIAADKITKASPSLLLALMKEYSGKDASADLNRVKDILGCDCGCGSESVEPRLINNNNQGYNITGENAAKVVSSMAGSTVNFNLNVKHILLSLIDTQGKAIDIQRIESAGSIIYKLGFNYLEMSKNILDTISDSVELTSLINEIITASSADLDGIDGFHIIDLKKVSYNLTESFAVAKTVKSIVIDGVALDAPNALQLSNALAIQNWLNSLNQGVFSVSADSVTKKTTIVSNKNENRISTLTLIANGETSVIAFNRADGTLSDILQAILTYLKDLSALRVRVGAELSLPLFNAEGVVVSKLFKAEDTLISYLTHANALFIDLASKVSATKLSCATIKAVFVSTPKEIKSEDVIYGTKDNACAVILYKEMITSILARISGDAELKALFDALIAGGSIGCSTPANVTAYISTAPIFSYTKTENFTKNNCSGGGGTIVSFSKVYSSFISVADAQAASATVTSVSAYNTEGQDYANANGACIPKNFRLSPSYNSTFVALSGTGIPALALPSGTSGAVEARFEGTIPAGIINVQITYGVTFPLKLTLTVDNVTVDEELNITASGTYQVNLPNPVPSTSVISIAINS